MDWVMENKAWLFNGAAVVIPLTIIGWMAASKKIKQTQRGGDNSTNIQVGGNLKLGDKKSDDSDG